jgi:hypothetical protein
LSSNVNELLAGLGITVGDLLGYDLGLKKREAEAEAKVAQPFAG